MKRVLLLMLVLMLAMPVAANAATNCTSQFGNCPSSRNNGTRCATSNRTGENCSTSNCPTSNRSTSNRSTSNCPTSNCATSNTSTSNGTSGNCPSSAVQTLSSTRQASGSSISSMAAQVVAETNNDRAKAGLAPLTVDYDLSAAACVRAQEIVSKFSHTRPNGQRGITASSKAVGENIAKGQQSAAKVMAAWMSSSGHKATILRPSLRTIGVCAYQVNGIMYWVQLFGK